MVKIGGRIRTAQFVSRSYAFLLLVDGRLREEALDFFVTTRLKDKVNSLRAS